MNLRTSLFTLLLLVATMSVSAQTLPAGPVGAPAGPLNLSQPAKTAPEKAAAIEMEKLLGPSTAPAELSDVGNAKEEAGSAQRLPYGAGFENRQHGVTGGGAGRGGRGRGR